MVVENVNAMFSLMEREIHRKFAKHFVIKHAEDCTFIYVTAALYNNTATFSLQKTATQGRHTVYSYTLQRGSVCITRPRLTRFKT